MIDYLKNQIKKCNILPENDKERILNFLNTENPIKAINTTSDFSKNLIELYSTVIYADKLAKKNTINGLVELTEELKSLKKNISLTLFSRYRQKILYINNLS